MEEYLGTMQRSGIPSALIDDELQVIGSNALFMEIFLGVDKIFPSGFYVGNAPDFSDVIHGEKQYKAVNTAITLRGKKMLFNLRVTKADGGNFYFCAIKTGGGLNRHSSILRPVSKIKKNLHDLDKLMNKVRGLVFINNSDKIFYANAAAIDFLGFDNLDELEKSGRCLCSFFENTADKSLADFPEWKEMISSGELKGDESIACIKNGNTGELHYFLADVTVNNADSQEFITVLSDVTDVIDAARAKNSTNEQFKEMFMGHSAPMLLVDQDDSGKILSANYAACVFYGYEMDELLSLTIDYLNIMPIDAIKSEMMKAKSKSRNYFNFIHRQKDGNVKHVEVYSAPVEYCGKKVLFSIILDSTEKKLYEIQLRDMNHRLNTKITAEMQASREKEAYSRCIFNLNNDAVFVFKLNNWLPEKFIDFNTAAERLINDVQSKTIFDVLNTLYIDNKESFINDFLENGSAEITLTDDGAKKVLKLLKMSELGENYAVLIVSDMIKII